MSRLRQFKLQYLLWVALLLTAGCSGNRQPPQKHTITIAAMKFSPDTVFIAPGDTLEFINQDMVDHDITDFPDKKWTSSKLQPGDSWIYVPVKSGSYFCSIHQVMKGEIVIK